VSAEDWVQDHAEGWCRDPYLAHEDRWYSDGQPTKLVRDGGVESYDPPPEGSPEGELVQLPLQMPRKLDVADDPDLLQRRRPDFPRFWPRGV
jgi:hypothetical protein